LKESHGPTGFRAPGDHRSHPGMGRAEGTYRIHRRTEAGAEGTLVRAAERSRGRYPRAEGDGGNPDSAEGSVCRKVFSKVCQGPRHEGRARGTKRVGRAEGSVGGVQRGAVKVPTRQRAWAERRSEEPNTRGVERSRSAWGAGRVV
jgi:hypothetical protein